ncbi:sensor histidine kinase [Dactylosporangium siamense]|uniref:histidine kinase n=1 Tax=Dactylosporangium siamense TaxID=685454 RepID=A0A919Q083_9ACTN|nr:sensor histidine kinase [Dactylosporangium siamense]GIG51813.1 two-component sensor histidine kinase [Dactylosporangium siamense]
MSIQDVGHPWATTVLRLTHRVRQWDARHRWVLDAGGVLLLFLAFGAPDIGDRHDGDGPPISWTDLPAPQMLLLQAALLVPLYWRRRSPFLAFHAVLVVFIVQWAAGIMFRADVAVLVALYNLVLHCSLRRLPWAAPTLLVAYVLVVARLADAIGTWDAMFGLAVFGTAAVALGLAIRLRRAQLATLRERAVQLEIERDQRSRLAAATERTRVAREMHDIVGHSLSVIVTLADGGAYAADTAPARSKEALQLIGDTGRRSLAELRRMLGVLREQADEPDLSPQPGLADLDPLCRRVRAAGPRVEYRSSGDLDALDAGVQLAAYRIVQEALTNTLKHAGPDTSVRLDLLVDGDRLRIAVRDNGAPQTYGEPGHGLIGMRERAAMYGGTVTAGPAPGGGWSVEADLDLRPTVESDDA